MSNKLIFNADEGVLYTGNLMGPNGEILPNLRRVEAADVLRWTTEEFEHAVAQFRIPLGLDASTPHQVPFKQKPKCDDPIQEMPERIIASYWRDGTPREWCKSDVEREVGDVEYVRVDAIAKKLKRAVDEASQACSECYTTGACDDCGILATREYFNELTENCQGSDFGE